MLNKGLSGLIGLSDIKTLAQIDMDACKVTGKPLGNCILQGPGGLGKSALAEAIADEMNYHLVIVEAAALKNRDKIAEKLRQAHAEADQCQKRLLFFIDECHRLSIENQEVFYFCLDKERPRIDSSHGTIYFKPFTIFAATTRMDALDQRSFVGRFDNVWNLKPYPADVISIILSIWFHEHNLQAGYEISSMIAERSLGTPRQAIKIAQKIENLCLGRRTTIVTADICNKIFELECIDKVGLTDIHTQYLKELENSKIPKGLNALAGKTGQHIEIIAGVIEPILLSLNFIDMTCKGRILTEKGRLHLQNSVQNSSCID